MKSSAVFRDFSSCSKISRRFTGQFPNRFCRPYGPLAAADSPEQPPPEPLEFLAGLAVDFSAKMPLPGIPINSGKINA